MALRRSPLAFHQQATDQVGGDQLGGAGEEALGEGWEIVGDGRAGYGSGLQVFIHPADIKLWMTQNGGITPTHSAAMLEEQLKAFLQAVKADAGLQEKLKAASDADAVITIAKAAGFIISAEELKRAQAEVSEEELEGVAGGGAPGIDWKGSLEAPQSFCFSCECGGSLFG